MGRKGASGREYSPDKGWTAGISEADGGLGLGCHSDGDREGEQSILHQGPHCPFLAESEGNQTWSFYILATALAGAYLASTDRSRARTRSEATQDEDSISQVPRCINPREPAALSPEKQDPSICKSVFWDPSAPCRQEATQWGRGLHLPWGGKETDLPSLKLTGPVPRNPL